jgi:hypothetical protein
LGGATFAQLHPHEGFEGIVFFYIEAGVTHATHLETGNLEVPKPFIDLLLDLRLEQGVFPPLLLGLVLVQYVSCTIAIS